VWSTKLHNCRWIIRFYLWTRPRNAGFSYE